MKFLIQNTTLYNFVSHWYVYNSYYFPNALIWNLSCLQKWPISAAYYSSLTLAGHLAIVLFFWNCKHYNWQRISSAKSCECEKQHPDFITCSINTSQQVMAAINSMSYFYTHDLYVQGRGTYGGLLNVSC